MAGVCLRWRGKGNGETNNSRIEVFVLFLFLFSQHLPPIVEFVHAEEIIAMRSPRTLLPGSLTSPVGNGQSNNQDSIRWTKEALQHLGRYPKSKEITGYIDRPLTEAMGNYQRDRGLKRDGKLLPGGATEQALKVELAYLLEV